MPASNLVNVEMKISQVNPPVLSDETRTSIFPAVVLKIEMIDTDFIHQARWSDMTPRFMDVQLAGGGAGTFPSFEIPRDHLW